MLQRITILFLLIATCGVSSAQRMNNYRLQCSGCLLVKATPTTLVNRYSSELPIGVEYGFWKDAAVVLEAGIPVNKVIHKKGKEDYRYDYVLRSELRAYFGYHRNSKWHVGLEGFMKQQAYHETGGNYLVNESYSVDYFYEAADVKKRVYGGAVKTGFCFHVAGGLFIDLYAGFGAKSVSIGRENIQQLTGPVKATRFLLYTHNEDNVPDNATLIYLPVGISLSWQLNKILD